MAGREGPVSKKRRSILEARASRASAAGAKRLPSVRNQDPASARRTGRSGPADRPLGLLSAERIRSSSVRTARRASANRRATARTSERESVPYAVRSLRNEPCRRPRVPESSSAAAPALHHEHDPPFAHPELVLDPLRARVRPRRIVEAPPLGRHRRARRVRRRALRRAGRRSVSGRRRRRPLRPEHRRDDAPEFDREVRRSRGVRELRFGLDAESRAQPVRRRRDRRVHGAARPSAPRAARPPRSARRAARQRARDPRREPRVPRRTRLRNALAIRRRRQVAVGALVSRSRWPRGGGSNTSNALAVTFAPRAKAASAKAARCRSPTAPLLRPRRASAGR